MTTILWNKTWIWADTKWVNGTTWIINVKKVTRLPNWELLWIAWIFIDSKLILEIYERHIESSWITELKTIIDVINFITTIEENIFKENDRSTNEYIFISKDIQLKINCSWQVQILDEDDYLCIWSGSSFASTAIRTAKKINVNLEPGDLFEIISSMDIYTNNELVFYPTNNEDKS